MDVRIVGSASPQMASHSPRRLMLSFLRCWGCRGLHCSLVHNPSAAHWTQCRVLGSSTATAPLTNTRDADVNRTTEFGIPWTSCSGTSVCRLLWVAVFKDRSHWLQSGHARSVNVTCFQWVRLHRTRA